MMSKQVEETLRQQHLAFIRELQRQKHLRQVRRQLRLAAVFGWGVGMLVTWWAWRILGQ